MSTTVATELDRILTTYATLAPAAQGLRQPFDPQWISPCQVGDPDAEGMIAWAPVRRPVPADWSGLEQALDVPVHTDVAAFYGSFWSDCIPVRAEEGTATLIQVWNERDFERLIENLIGHALQKRRRREPLTLFVACTEEGEFNLCVDNTTGAVLLEQPGQAPKRMVAESLAELLSRMEPAAQRNL